MARYGHDGKDGESDSIHESKAKKRNTLEDHQAMMRQSVESMKRIGRELQECEDSVPFQEYRLLSDQLRAVHSSAGGANQKGRTRQGRNGTGLSKHHTTEGSTAALSTAVPKEPA